VKGSKKYKRKKKSIKVEEDIGELVYRGKRERAKNHSN
jgi:hypothetical protein